jgi:protein-tyrosine-phosphatase
VLRNYPASKRKVHFIGALAEHGPLVVPDPYGGTASDYDATYRRIKELVAETEVSGGRPGS